MGWGPDVRTLEDADGNTSIAVDKTAVAYTKTISLKLGEYFSLSYKATSDGNVKLRIEIQQSHSPMAAANEGTSTDTTYVEPESMSDIESALATETWHIKALSPICMPYFRLKITGLGAPNANDASTVIQFKLGTKEII